MIKLLEKKEFSILKNRTVSLPSRLLSTFTIENVKLDVLMSRTGYYTITGYDSEEKIYTLDVPNEEVRESLIFCIEEYLTRSSDQEGLLSFLRKNLISKDMESFRANMTSLFACIPYALHIKQEKYYQSLFLLLTKLMKAEVNVEESTNKGRIDAVIKTKNYIYIFEFKLNSSAEKALKQIQEKKYYEKFLHENKPIFLVGINFAMKDKELDILCESVKHA